SVTSGSAAILATLTLAANVLTHHRSGSWTNHTGVTCGAPPPAPTVATQTRWSVHSRSRNCSETSFIDTLTLQLAELPSPGPRGGQPGPRPSRPSPERTTDLRRRPLPACPGRSRPRAPLRFPGATAPRAPTRWPVPRAGP